MKKFLFILAILSIITWFHPQTVFICGCDRSRERGGEGYPAPSEGGPSDKITEPVDFYIARR